MIRVIYRWQVEPKKLEKFKQTWRLTTNQVHESVPGALGSFMLRACENDTEIVTIAKWDSLDSWKLLGKQQSKRNGKDANLRKAYFC